MSKNRLAIAFVPSSAILSSALLSLIAGTARGAENYNIEPAHAAVTFKIDHAGLSWTYGRFNDVGGKFSIDAAPAKTSFSLGIKPESIDTGNAKRDEHLRSPDFFNVKQFPGLSFASTSVKPVDGGYAVSGDLTLHGVTKPVNLVLKGGKKAEFPPGSGTQRTGYSTELSLKRSDFGMDKMVGMIGDEVRIAISFEGVKAP
jgi:polyisoprenoid-binding protein YceI